MDKTSESSSSPKAVTLDVENARLQALLDETIPPPNEFAAYILSQLKLNGAQGLQIQEQLMAARRQVKMLEEHAMRLAGVQEQYIRDLRKWSAPIQGDPVPKTAPVGQNGTHEAVAPA